MYSKFLVCDKIKVFGFSAFFGLCCICNVASPQLEAAGWGKTKEVTTYEDVNWNKVFCDLDGIYFTASVPNYSSASLQNSDVAFNGEVGDDVGYVISTSYNMNFTPPGSQKDFIKLIQDANQFYRVQAVDAKKFGAKYVVDLVPAERNTTAFWRFISTKNRLIQLGTDDTNEKRRIYFFESISIK